MRSLAVAFSVALACAHSVPAPASHEVLPSRLRESRADGFYLQPAGLADDYPEESDPVAKMRRDIGVLHRAGTTYLRFAVGWDSTESQPGKYDWSEWDALFALLREAGITPLPYVCYTPRWVHPEDAKDFWRRPADPARFARFMSAAAQRYRGQVLSWELWNEPDNEQYWLGTVEQYARLVEAGARAVRAAGPGGRGGVGGVSEGRG